MKIKERIDKLKKQGFRITDIKESYGKTIVLAERTIFKQREEKIYAYDKQGNELS